MTVSARREAARKRRDYRSRSSHRPIFGQPGLHLTPRPGDLGTPCYVRKYETRKAANAASPASANRGRRRATKAPAAALGTACRGIAPTARSAIAATRTISRASWVSPEPGRIFEARAPRTPESGRRGRGALIAAAASLPLFPLTPLPEPPAELESPAGAGSAVEPQVLSPATAVPTTSSRRTTVCPRLRARIR